MDKGAEYTEAKKKESDNEPDTFKDAQCNCNSNRILLYFLFFFLTKSKLIVSIHRRSIQESPEGQRSRTYSLCHPHELSVVSDPDVGTTV
jgi:hypothetical protein